MKNLIASTIVLFGLAGCAGVAPPPEAPAVSAEDLQTQAALDRVAASVQAQNPGVALPPPVLQQGQSGCKYGIVTGPNGAISEPLLDANGTHICGGAASDVAPTEIAAN